MSHYSGSVPDTKRAPDWRDAASCRDVDPELFFPKGDSGPWLHVIEQAKQVCRRCPSADACLQFALDEEVGHGIFGGLTAKERDSLIRSARRRRTTPEDAAAKADAARRPRRERTLQTIYDDNTVHLHDGHLAWTGPDLVYADGRRYTPRQLVFVLDRGEIPDGPVLADCGVKACVLPAHQTDRLERSPDRADATKAAV